eukprot:scaffold5085_cov115-Cylindrotheca_fusiformis.AAC.13
MISANDDIDAFRKSNHHQQQPFLSSHQWMDLEEEVIHTHERLDQDLCQHMLTQLLSKQHTVEEEEEYGPTGTWKYQSLYGSSNNNNSNDENRNNNYDGRLLYLRRDVTTGQEQVVVLDLEEPYQIRSMSLSVDETLIAYVITSGDDDDDEDNTTTSSIRIRHVESGTEIPIVASSSNSTAGIMSVELGPSTSSLSSNRTHGLYWVGGLDEHNGQRPDRVYGAEITVDTTSSEGVVQLHITAEPTLLYQSKDPAVMVDVQRTKGCHYVAIQAKTKVDNEIFLSSNPTEPSLLLPVLKSEKEEEEEGSLQYHLDVGEEEDVVILASRNGEEYRVLETTVDSLPIHIQDCTQTTFPIDPEYSISDMDLFRDYIVFYERSKRNGLERIRTHSRTRTQNLPAPPVIVPLPSNQEGQPHRECYKLSPGGNMYFGSQSLSFRIESPVHPPSLYEFDMQRQELKQQQTSEEQVASQEPGIIVHAERVLVPSKDGTQVPLSLIHSPKQESKKAVGQSFFDQLLLDPEEEIAQKSPVVLIGYGAYGEPMDLQYNPSWEILVRRGYVLAFAHTRGGGDLGREWYSGGCRENKMKAIEDFEACAHYLRTSSTYCHPPNDRLTAMAFSAGGVLVGAAMNRDPELFDNVVLTNAFLDVYETMMNPNLFLTSHEWDEYGNPLQDADVAKRIRSYCPTAGLSSSAMATCPQTLVVGTVDDENVPFWNAVIFAKKLRECIQDKDRVFLHLEAKGGHHLGSRRLHVSALELAFIIQHSEFTTE